MSRRFLVACSMTLTACPCLAIAEDIVLESYTGHRPDDAARLVNPVVEELHMRGFISSSVGKRFERQVSRPALVGGLPVDFVDRIERGHRAWVDAQFDDAVAILEPLVELARDNPETIARDPSLRVQLLKAMIALALSEQRLAQTTHAREVLAEVLRTFPDADLSLAGYGRDARDLFEQVRSEAGASRGKLVVRPTEESAAVFVDEHQESVGPITKADLVGGDYRVFVRVGELASRIHRATVRAGEEVTVAIDPTFDDAIQTDAWTGFQFATAEQREKLEDRYGAEVARDLGATQVAIVGVDVVGGQLAVVGSVVDGRSGREVRRASIAIGKGYPIERLRALGRFLAEGDATTDIDVTVGAPAPKQRQWDLWTGLAAIAAGAGGGGAAIKLASDAQAAGRQLQVTCAQSCTADQIRTLQDQQRSDNRGAVIAGIAGGVVAAGGLALIAVHYFYRPHRASKTTNVTATAIDRGALATLTLTF